MISYMRNVRFVSKSVREYANSDGTKRLDHKALFTQDGASPLEIKVSESVFHHLTELEVYDLEVEISSYDRRFFCKVVQASESGSFGGMSVA